MSRIVFVTPGSVFLLDERVFVNLGILKVAAACRARGHEVGHLDLDGVANPEDALRVFLRSGPPADWYAFTATTPQMPSVARLVAVVREEVARPRVMIGGPHPTLTLAAVKQERKLGRNGRAHRALARLEEMFDCIVAGDGEDAVEVALRDAAFGGTRIVDGDDPKGPLFLTKKRLDEVPWPARELIDLTTYHYTIDGVPATSLVAQLGCPFNCSFCGGRASPMLRRARQRSTEAVLAEMEHLHVTHGYRGFMLYDDELNVNPKMVELMRGIVALQRKHGVEFRLRGFVKAELFTAEQAAVMYEAGFRWLLTGFEAGHPRILENIQKKATVEDNTRAVELARGAGLKVKALMSVGHAGESAETIDALRAWLLYVKPDDFDCTIITPYPGSPYYDEAVESTTEHAAFAAETGAKIWTYVSPVSGDRLHAVELDYTKTADYYKGDPNGGYRAYVFTDHLTGDELVRMRDELERSVRGALGIPFNPSAPAIRFEHSMGQPGPGALPPSIWRAAS